MASDEDPLVTYDMKFADEHVEPVLEGEKTLTVRLAEEWPQVFDRDGLRLLDEDGAPFGRAVVKRARTLDARDAYHVVNAHSGHQSYTDLDTFTSALEVYYPPLPIWADTDLRLVHFEVVGDGE